MRRRGCGQEEAERPREVQGHLNLGDPVLLGPEKHSLKYNQVRVEGTKICEEQLSQISGQR